MFKHFKRPIIITFSILICNFTFLFAQETSVNKTNQTLIKARLLTDEYKLDSAIILYNQVLASDEDNIEVLMNLESIYSKTSQYEEALTCTNKILELLPQNKQYFIRKGILLNKMDEDLEAISIFKTALEADSCNTFLLNQVADIYREINEVDSAYYYYSLALNIKPITSSIIKGTDILLKNNWNKGALYFLKKYYNRDEAKNKTLDHFLGRTLYLCDSTLDAVILLSDLYRNGDSTKVVCKYLGLSCWKSTYYDKAINALNQFTAQDTTDFLVYYALGQCHQSKRNYNQAIDAFNQAMALYERNVENENLIILGLASSYKGAGEYKTAIKYLNQHFENDTTNTYALYQIASIYTNDIKDKEKAIECYQFIIDKVNQSKHPQEAKPLLEFCNKRIEFIKSNKTEEEFWRSNNKVIRKEQVTAREKGSSTNKQPAADTTKTAESD